MTFLREKQHVLSIVRDNSSKALTAVCRSISMWRLTFIWLYIWNCQNIDSLYVYAISYKIRCGFFVHEKHNPYSDKDDGPSVQWELLSTQHNLIKTFIGSHRTTKGDWISLCHGVALRTHYSKFANKINNQWTSLPLNNLSWNLKGKRKLSIIFFYYSLLYYFSILFSYSQNVKTILTWATISKLKWTSSI